MLPDPLHPAIVHFPIVFMLLLPLIGFGALYAIRRGSHPRLAWGLPVAFAAGLAASTWLAVETGESQEEKVEEVVAEPALNAHEESAERFLWLSGALLLLTGAGLLKGRLGGTARVAATIGSVGLAALGAQVGHTGGKLVYQYGAASAYAQAGGGGEGGAGGEDGATEGAQRGDGKAELGAAPEVNARKEADGDD
ncbi:MAG TPA: DUF2231 domain-containing protein [Gemmatimonadales bacterium]|nr:DUF2231 domain-containing protein [Gemmatimonadales bacterium]